jgi:hypothetical protein
MQRLARDMGDRDHDVPMWIAEGGRDLLSLRLGESDEFRITSVSKRDADRGRAPSGYYLLLVDLNDSHVRRLYGPYATDLEARHAAAREIADDDRPEVFSGRSPRQMVVEGFAPFREGPVATEGNAAKGRSKVVEDAIEALRLYHGSGGASVRDQEKLRLRAQKKVEAAARKYGRGVDPSAAIAEAWRQLGDEARARGSKTPMPGKDY